MGLSLEEHDAAVGEFRQKTVEEVFLQRRRVVLERDRRIHRLMGRDIGDVFGAAHQQGLDVEETCPFADLAAFGEIAGRDVDRQHLLETARQRGRHAPHPAAELDAEALRARKPGTGEEAVQKARRFLAGRHEFVEHRVGEIVELIAVVGQHRPVGLGLAELFPLPRGAVEQAAQRSLVDRDIDAAVRQLILVIDRLYIGQGRHRLSPAFRAAISAFRAVISRACSSSALRRPAIWKASAVSRPAVGLKPGTKPCR